MNLVKMNGCDDSFLHHRQLDMDLPKLDAVFEVQLEKPVDLLERSTSLGSDILGSEIRHGPIY